LPPVSACRGMVRPLPVELTQRIAVSGQIIHTEYRTLGRAAGRQTLVSAEGAAANASRLT
jgi:hypothetical protein